MVKRYFVSKTRKKKTYLANIVIIKEISPIKEAITNLKQAILSKIIHYLTQANFSLAKTSHIQNSRKVKVNF
jgi:hypothetical protein